MPSTGFEPVFDDPQSSVLSIGRRGQLAEEVGLEPTNPLRGSGFQDRCNSHYATPPILFLPYKLLKIKLTLSFLKRKIKVNWERCLSGLKEQVANLRPLWGLVGSNPTLSAFIIKISNKKIWIEIKFKDY